MPFVDADVVKPTQVLLRVTASATLRPGWLVMGPYLLVSLRGCQGCYGFIEVEAAERMGFLHPCVEDTSAYPGQGEPRAIHLSV
jgi:hypothetical protein